MFLTNAFGHIGVRRAHGRNGFYSRLRGTPMGTYDMETRRMMTSSPQLPLVSSSVKRRCRVG
jgi:hypothetical protein